jgi:hypothetical protein
MANIQILLLAVNDIEGNSHELFEVQNSNLSRTEKPHLPGKLFPWLGVTSGSIHPDMKKEC